MYDSNIFLVRKNHEKSTVVVDFAPLSGFELECICAVSRENVFTEVRAFLCSVS